MLDGACRVNVCGRYPTEVVPLRLAVLYDVPLALNQRKPCPDGAEDCPCVNLHITGIKNEPAPIRLQFRLKFVKVPFRAVTVPFGMFRLPSTPPLMFSVPSVRMSMP